jgi:rhodanese-related sulfurtransferase
MRCYNGVYRTIIKKRFISMKQMSVTEVSELLASSDVRPVKIDVREAHELQNGMIEGAIHIPMNTVPEKLDELAQFKSDTIVLICRSGKRSDQVGQFLEHQGFSDVINMVGGMNGWASEIDTSMNVY